MGWVQRGGLVLTGGGVICAEQKAVSAGTLDSGFALLAHLTRLSLCLQQLNAIIAASMSLKSSTKLRNILEVRGLGPDRVPGKARAAPAGLRGFLCPGLGLPVPLGPLESLPAQKLLRRAGGCSLGAWAGGEGPGWAELSWARLEEEGPGWAGVLSWLCGRGGLGRAGSEGLG